MKKLGMIAAVGVALLLAGCTGSPAPVETADAEPEAPADFCEVLETNGPAYNAVFDKEAVNASDLTVFELWASNLTESAPDELHKTESDYVEPLRPALSGEVETNNGN